MPFLLFIAVPLVELYFIIVVGEMIGAFWTVILVILTAFIGINLLRIQGMSTLIRAQRNMVQGQVPAMEMMEGIALGVAGVMLLTPGFITDTMGALLLIPATRQAIIRYFMSRSRMSGPNMKTGFGSIQSGRYRQQKSDVKPPGSKPSDTKSSDTKPRVGRTIDGEYRRED